MRHSGIYQREQSFLPQGPIIQYLLRHINKLDYLVLLEQGLDDFFAHLDIYELLFVIGCLDWIYHLVDIILDVRCIRCEQILQRVRHIVDNSAF